MEKVKEKNNIFLQIKNFFNNFLESGEEAYSEKDLQDPDLQKSIKEIKKLESRFFEETVTVNHKIRKQIKELPQISEETLSKMRAKLDKDAKLKEGTNKER